MAKRCLNTMVVDGQLVTLMQISDYSILNTSGNPVMVYESSNPPDSYISEYGYDLCAFFPTALHSGEPDVYKDIEDTTAYLKQRYYYDSGIEQNDVSIYSNAGTRWMGAGYAIANQDLIGFNLALVVDDDEQKAWVLGCIFLRGQYYRLWLLNDSSQYSAIYNEIKSIDGLSPSGGAGSGYIGNTLVSNKKMVGYNVPTSSAESTKTESTNEYSESPVSGKPKAGNGFAKIKFLRSCWGGEEVTILWAGDSNKMTVQISNSNILFKLYTGDTAIYSFTAYAGSTVLDADNIYVHFLIESEQQLAKPSMVYANGSVLSYNQEEPTDAEMADIYTWLSAGLPSA